MKYIFNYFFTKYFVYVSDTSKFDVVLVDVGNSLNIGENVWLNVWLKVWLNFWLCICVGHVLPDDVLEAGLDWLASFINDELELGVLFGISPHCDELGINDEEIIGL